MMIDEKQLLEAVGERSKLAKDLHLQQSVVTLHDLKEIIEALLTDEEETFKAYE